MANDAAKLVFKTEEKGRKLNEWEGATIKI